MGDLDLPFIQAKAHGGPFSLPTHIRVIHSTEGPMSRGNARALAGPNWFAGPAGTSAHDIFDPSEGVIMLRPNIIGYHVGPGGNGFTRGSEHCGRVSLTRAQWLSVDGQEMLDRSARYNAAAAHRDGVLPRWLSLTQLRAKQPGFCTHNDIRLVFGGTTHSDPGPNFPYDWYMARVQAYYNGVPIQEDDVSLKDLQDFFNADRINIPRGQPNNDNIFVNLTGMGQGEINRDNAEAAALRALAANVSDTKSAVTALAGAVNTAGMTDAQVTELADRLAPHLHIDAAELKTALKAAVTDLVTG